MTIFDDRGCFWYSSKPRYPESYLRSPTQIVRINIVDSDPSWAASFERIKGELILNLALDPIPYIDIHHVGSTSVPHLAAKPIIGIDLVVSVSQLWEQLLLYPSLVTLITRSRLVSLIRVSIGSVFGSEVMPTIRGRPGLRKTGRLEGRCS